MLIGIEIGGTKLQVVAGTTQRGIVRRWRGKVQPQLGGQEIRQQIAKAVESMRMDEPDVSAIGIGFGGPVDWKQGRIRKSHHVRGWDGFEIGPWLREATKLPVAVDNDANVGALGEARHGAGRGHDPVFYVTLGSGVGGGLVAGSQIYHGYSPGESEFGHLRLDREGTIVESLCSGWADREGTIVESLCSGWAIDARIRRLQSEQPGSLLARLVGNASGGESLFLAPALEKNDPAALQVLNELAENLGFALSHVVHLMHPQMIVLGGGLSLIGAALQVAVEKALPQYVMGAFHPPPLVRLASLGEDAVPIGALELVAGAT